MTAPGRYASNDGSFGRSAGSAAVRGGVLVGIAVVLGLVILAVAYDGGDGGTATASDDTTADDTGDTDSPDATPTTAPADTGDDSGDDTGDDDGAVTPTTSAPVGAVRPPAEVKVVVANGVGEPGLAGQGTATLGTAGYVTEAANAAEVPTATSSILYIDGYAGEAAAVAAVLGAPASIIAAAPPDPTTLVSPGSAEAVADFHIFVIQGEDRLAG